MVNPNTTSDINEQELVPISELPFQYNNSVISNTIKITEQKEKIVKEKNKKKGNNMETDNKKSQHSIEQWFSPMGKKKKIQKQEEIVDISSPESNSDNSSLIDLTEPSKEKKLQKIETTNNENEKAVILKTTHNDNKDNEINITTPKKDKKDKKIVKSPYFQKKNIKINKNNNITKTKTIELIAINSGSEEQDSENTNQEICQSTDQESEKSAEIIDKTKDEKEKNTINNNFEILVIEKDKKKKKNISSENNSIVIESKEEEVKDNDNLIKSRLRSLRGHSKNSSTSSTNEKDSILNHKPIIDESISLIDDGEEADDENEKSDSTTRSKKFSRELNNLGLDINDEKKDISSTSVVINGRSLRKRPSKEITKNTSITNTSKIEYIKKKIDPTKETVVLLSDNSNNRKLTSYLTFDRKSKKLNNKKVENEIELNSSEDMEIEQENENNNSNEKLPKKRQRQSSDNTTERKRTRRKSEQSQEDNENDKKVTYKQASLNGFSKVLTPSVRSFKPRKKSSTSKVKKVLPIPEFTKLSHCSVFDRNTNLVIPDILKLLSITDFLEKFGDCILELDQKINFNTLYQAIVYPTQNSFKLLSSIYVAILVFLIGKEETSNLIIPLNELTWQYYLIPTITETLRIKYRLKRNTMYNYPLPNHLAEIKSNEFYRISPLAHVKTLHQLIAILADTLSYREKIEAMIDKMVQLGNQRRIDIAERKNMEDEINNLHRDVNIVGIRIKTLELEIKKQKEKEKEEISKSKTRLQRHANSNLVIDHRALSGLHSEYNKKVTTLDKLKRALKKKDNLLLAKKKEKLDIKNKIFKGNERFLGIDRNHRYYWVIDIKYTSQKPENEGDSEDEQKKNTEKIKILKPKSLLSFITKDEKGKLALNNTEETTDDENIYGIVIEDFKRKENQDNYYNIYYYDDDSILYDYSYEMISSTGEIKKLISTLQLNDYDEELLHTNIIDFFSSRGYKIDSQTKLENSSTDINVETSLQNFKSWCNKLGKEVAIKNEVPILDGKNVVMFLNKINEISFYLESTFGLPSITIILSDMANNDTMEIELKSDQEEEQENIEKEKVVDLDNYKKNYTLSYHPKFLHNITNKIKSLYTEHSDSIIHENKKNDNIKILKNKLKGVELAIFNNNDIKLIVKKDKKEVVKFSEYQLEKIDDINNLSGLYSWFFEIKQVLDVKSEIISGSQKPRNTSQKGSHNLRERKKTNYNEIYASDDDFM